MSEGRESVRDENGTVLLYEELTTCVRVVCRQYLRVHALEPVVRLIDTFIDSCDSWTLPNAAKKNSPRLLSRVIRSARASDLSKEDIVEQCNKAMKYAATMGSLPMLLQLLALQPMDFLDESIGVAAACSGDVTLLQWLVDNQLELFDNEELKLEQIAFDVAAERGCMETVQWLVTTFSAGAWLLSPAALGGHLEMVQWLHENANIDATQRHRALGLMQRVHLSYCAQLAEECGKPSLDGLKAMQWRFHDSRAPRATDAMDWAAVNGHFDVMKWLDANRTDGCSDAAVNSAAEAGNMEMLLWLDAHYSEQWTFEAMDHAARGGHLAVVKWIHANRAEGCSPKAMDWAAGNGHLDVVQWLHTNRHEGCTVLAMDRAARNGHLDVVQWLHEHRQEGCTTNAMDSAAKQGHLDVVQWLHENRTEGCTTAAVDRAAGKGHLDVVKWLFANRTEGGTARAAVNATDEHHHEVLQWFEENEIDLPVPGWGNDDDEEEEEGDEGE